MIAATPHNDNKGIQVTYSTPEETAKRMGFVPPMVGPGVTSPAQTKFKPLKQIGVKTPNLKVYTRRTVLKALMMYHEHRIKHFIQSKMHDLYAARAAFGTQFIIDLFICTEEFSNHYPAINISMCRDDIIRLLNAVPNYRILYEEGRMYSTL